MWPAPGGQQQRRQGAASPILLPVLHAITRCTEQVKVFVWLHWNGCALSPLGRHLFALGETRLMLHHIPSPSDTGLHTHAPPHATLLTVSCTALPACCSLDCRGQQLGGSSSEDDAWDDPDSPHGQQRRHSTLRVPGQTGGGSGQQGRVSGMGRPLSATRSSSIGAGSRPSSGGVAPRAGGGSSAGGTPWK